MCSFRKRREPLEFPLDLHLTEQSTVALLYNSPSPFIMAAVQNPPSYDEKPGIFEDEHPEKPVPRVDKIDYSGAHAKTDPKEIALVRKLDKWIMVSTHRRFLF